MLRVLASPNSTLKMKLVHGYSQLMKNFLCVTLLAGVATLLALPIYSNPSLALDSDSNFSCKYASLSYPNAKHTFQLELRKAFPKIFELSADELTLTESSKLRVGQKSRVFEQIRDAGSVKNLKGYFLTNNTVVLTFDAYWQGSVRYRCDTQYELLTQRIKKQQLVTQASEPKDVAVSETAKLEEERKARESEARIEALEQKLAALESKSTQTNTEQTTEKAVFITNTFADGASGRVFGRVASQKVSQVLINDEPVEIAADSTFAHEVYVPSSGIGLEILAILQDGTSQKTSLFLDRSNSVKTNTLTFDNLNPLKREVQKNSNAIALIVGVEDYEKTQAKAIYAAADADVFSDYATLKLGIPTNRVNTITNESADLSEILLLVQEWLIRLISEGETDVYIFFAGHGLASDDGEEMYLLPFDGSPRLLDRTGIQRKELFATIAAAKPRSVTVFLDTCYSGTTRGPDSLIASRPVVIKARQQDLPDGFTVMTAAAGDQTAKPLDEAKHGMFSYFLMKGMEGAADVNQDNQITTGELHAYVQQNVIQQSSGSQTPELQGDADRVLVRFQ